MNPLSWILLLALFVPQISWGRVRKIEVTQDQIVTVRTALGIATIIQVSDSPNSVVVGDQAAFKVEYLDQAITIKPLHGGAKSNLYIYTDFRRFNVQLVTGPEASADYVVYLENPKSRQKSSSVGWTKFKNHLNNDGLTLRVNRLGRTREGTLLVDFEIKSTKNEGLKPEWIWITQNGETRPIQNLILTGQEFGQKRSIQGILQLVRNDISESNAIRVELRRKKTSYLTLPKVTEWK